MYVNDRKKSFASLKDIVELWGVNLRTLKRRLRKEEKELGEAKFNRLWMFDPDARGHQPAKLYDAVWVEKVLLPKMRTYVKQPDPKPGDIRHERKTTTDVIERKQFVTNKKDLTHGERILIVEEICDVFELGVFDLGSACEKMGIDIGRFIQFISQDDALYSRWKLAKDNWLRTHGATLENLWYSRLIEKIETKTQIETKKTYQYEANADGGYTKKLIQETEVEKPYHPDASTFILAKKAIHDIYMMFPDEDRMQKLKNITDMTTDELMAEYDELERMEKEILSIELIEKSK